jgi:hypothetical protein
MAHVVLPAPADGSNDDITHQATSTPYPIPQNSKLTFLFTGCNLASGHNKSNT